MQAAKKLELTPDSPQLGSFTRKDAVKWIADGVHHIHSSPQIENDPHGKVSQNFLNGQGEAKYAWELKEESKQKLITSSATRREDINAIVEALGYKPDGSMAERIHAVLEELFTNSIFHAYRAKNGSDKYERSKKAELGPSERIEVHYNANKEGAYLAVEDHGGSLSFDDVASSFERCYNRKSDQIETKEGGAGLGFYMVFENVSHLKIEIEPGKKTVVSCWLFKKRSHDPNDFSFNYFERR